MRILPLAALSVTLAACSSTPPGGTGSTGTGSTSGATTTTSTTTSTTTGTSTSTTTTTTTGTSTGTSTSTTSSTSGASSTTGGFPSAPITGAPYDTWTWVDFPEAVCASGTPTGLAINPHQGSNTLLLYLEGGGQCSSSATCWGTLDAGPTATNTFGYDAGTFFASTNVQVAYPLFDRTNTANPFADMNMVFVPYCTGDLHSGHSLDNNLTLSDGTPQPTYFYGAYDLDVFLARLVPTFAPVSRVWLVGTSAGGFGTFLDFDRVQGAFDAGVDIMDDSGPPLLGPNQTSNNGAFTLWGYTAPSGCTAPCDSYADVFSYDLSVQATWTTPGELGFLSFTEDPTISGDFGYTIAQYPAALAGALMILPAAPTAATFLVYNFEHHVVESDPGVTGAYFPWMTKMVNRDPTWADETVDGG